MANNIGVIVGRFQINELHKGHLMLINHALERHQKVLIFLGIPMSSASERNPMDYYTRERMIKHAFPDVLVAPISDQRSNKNWSDNLDAAIKAYFQNIGPVKIYGSRNSFDAQYSGEYETEIVEEIPDLTASNLRMEAADVVLNTADFRQGIIYAAYNQYPTSYQTVDMACIRFPIEERENDHHEIVLVRKPGEELFRLPGGFINPEDVDMEAAAKREFFEECGMVGISNDPEYISSFRVDDWRYKRDNNKIMTALYMVRYQHGRPDPHDDVVEAELKDMVDLYHASHGLSKVIMEEHIPLINALFHHLDFKPLYPAEAMAAE